MTAALRRLWGPKGPPGGTRPWLALLSLCSGFFMILLDTTIVNIAIPQMLADLWTGLADIIWVNSVYLLPYAVPLLLTGRLGDRFGPKRIFLGGLGLFTGSSLACALSSAVGPLVAGAAAPGLGAAAMMPQTMAFVYVLFPAGRRGAAMGLWGATAGLATVSGPLLGGVIVEALSWEWIFFVNVPIGLAGSGWSCAWYRTGSRGTATGSTRWASCCSAWGSPPSCSGCRRASGTPGARSSARSR